MIKLLHLHGAYADNTKLKLLVQIVIFIKILKVIIRIEPHLEQMDNQHLVYYQHYHHGEVIIRLRGLVI